MELVARELKAMGVYTARSLSYAGVEYDILEHRLTPDQIADFDAWSENWSIRGAGALRAQYAFRQSRLDPSRPPLAR
jgi:hypothetical protein